MGPDMKSFDSVDEVLDYAVAPEIQANRLYAKLSQTVQKPRMREAL